MNPGELLITRVGRDIGAFVILDVCCAKEHLSLMREYQNLSRARRIERFPSLKMYFEFRKAHSDFALYLKLLSSLDHVVRNCTFFDACFSIDKNNVWWNDAIL